MGLCAERQDWGGGALIVGVCALFLGALSCCFAVVVGLVLLGRRMRRSAVIAALRKADAESLRLRGDASSDSSSKVIEMVVMPDSDPPVVVGGRAHPVNYA